MKVVRSLNPDSWRQFIENNPQGSIFHTPEMFEVFSRAKGHQPTLWAVVDDDNQPQALLTPVEITLLGGVASKFTTRAVTYSSVLASPGAAGEAALALLLQTYKKHVKGKFLFTELRNLFDLSHLQPLLTATGFVYEEHLNYLINLNQPPEDVMQAIGRRTRKQIRRGLRGGEVEMREVTNLSEFDEWYETLNKTYSNAQVPLADRSLFEAAFEVLHPKGMAKFLLAKVGDVIAACSVELPYKDIIYGWYGGSDRDYSKYLPNELLIWHILEWGATQSYRLYDFGGAGKPDEEYGVRDFKAKFGGDLVSFGRNICVHAPQRLKISEAGYQLYRRFL